EHGYCRSGHVSDPNGLTLEFTRDHPDAAKIDRDRRADAHAELRRWLKGDHTSNNTYRSSTRSGMHRSTDRILTTHVGSLPRSQAVVDVLFARERAEADAAANASVHAPGEGEAVIAAAVAEVVRRQVTLGIDVVSAGEMSK